jgi:hypothetical protein
VLEVDETAVRDAPQKWYARFSYKDLIYQVDRTAKVYRRPIGAAEFSEPDLRAAKRNFTLDSPHRATSQMHIYEVRRE